MKSTSYNLDIDAEWRIKSFKQGKQNTPDFMI